jgi:hypothetical protein
MMIHFRQGIGEVSESGLACKVWVRKRWKVDLRERDVRIKWLARLDLSLHEVNCPAGDLRVDLPPHLQVVDLSLACLLAFFALQHVRQRSDLGVVLRRGGPETDVGGIGDAVPFIETLVGWKAALGVAQVPLAEMSCGVALQPEQLGEGDFPLGKSVGASSVRDAGRSRADGQPAGHDGRPAGGTLALDIEIEEAQTFAGQLVDARGGCTAQDAAAVATRFAVAEVVGQHEYDVGLRDRFRRCDRLRGLSQQRRLRLRLLLVSAIQQSALSSQRGGIADDDAKTEQTPADVLAHS